MNASNRITILGSTGSVGCSTLSVIENNSDYTVYALTAKQNIELLFEQCQQYHPQFVVVVDEAAASRLASLLADSELDTQLLTGEAALAQVASDDAVDTVMAAIVGAAGLDSTLAAVEAGKRVLLANKESLVMLGHLLKKAALDSGAILLPIDSEHNAIFQCLPLAETGVHPDQFKHVDKIVLTASGGPFLNTALDELAHVTPEQACQHPKWSMGRKISVDSATMMNKGLEFIEACYLFELRPDQVQVLIHPQSIVHSMVYYSDGSVLAQMANPDMRIPIAYGLAWPERIHSGANVLDLVAEQALEFLEPDLERFPCLRLGMEAAEQGGTAPVVLNAANEVAVAAFLGEQLPFCQIPLLIEAVRLKIPCEMAPSLAIIRDHDQQARSLAKELILKDFY